MDEEILLEIKKAEEKAESIIQDAAKRKSEIIREAEIEAVKMKEREIEKYRAQTEKMIAAELEKIAKETAAILNRANEDAKKIKADPKNAGEAKKLLQKELDELLSGKHVLSGKNV